MVVERMIARIKEYVCVGMYESVYVAARNGANQNNNFFITLRNYYQGTEGKTFLNDDRNTFFFLLRHCCFCFHHGAIFISEMNLYD